MKSFLLAAGSGIRLRPLTDDLPKCLLPIQGVPLIRIWLENCRACGITQVLINTHAHAQKVRDFISSQNGQPHIRIIEEKELLGSAGTLSDNREFVVGEQEFFVLYADVLTNTDLRKLLAFHRRKKMLATLGIYQVPDPQRCGIVTVDDKEIVQNFVEKPQRPESNWAFSGLMVADPQVLNLIPSSRPADMGFHLLPQLIGKMAACKIPGYLLDIGTLDNYAAAQSSWPRFSSGLLR